MITMYEVSLVASTVKDFFHFSSVDACAIVEGIYDLEQPKDIIELGRKAYQYAERLANS